MHQIKDFLPRDYQSEIVQTSKEKNTLVVLPTGTGKTKIAILTAIERLKVFPNSNILIISPTRPLSAQIQKEFLGNTTIPHEQIVLLTGVLSPKKRQELWESALITVATPQTIQKDLEAKRISLSVTSLLVIDESHRSRENFANTKVAQFYIHQSKFPRILALTASPGGTKQRISEIQKNLFIDSIEIRTEEDIQEYIQKKEISWIEVAFPPEFKHLHSLIRTPYRLKLKELKKFGFTKPLSIISKRDILMLQQKFRKQLNEKNPAAYYGLSLTALLIKLDYAAELLETQGLEPLQIFLEKLQSETTKAAKTLISTPEIQQALSLTRHLISKKVKHPKVYMLKGLLKKELEKNPSSKIIVFANYRNTIDILLSELSSLAQIKAVKLIGQKSGLTQQEQISTISQFAGGIYNVMVCSSIAEEGIDIPGGAELAVFYDYVPSEIRGIQRRGRVGRTKAGRIICLLTKDTREMGYYFSSKRKESLMKKTLKNLQETQTTLPSEL